MTEQKLVYVVKGACIEVHRELGPGLLEHVYQVALCHELQVIGLKIECEKAVPMVYKGIRLDCGFRADVVVEGRLIIELKAVERLAAVHHVQLKSYLRLSGIGIGLLVNFHAQVLKDEMHIWRI